MSRLVADRSTAAVGLAIAAAGAAWWLGTVRLALDSGSDPARSASGVLLALWVARAVALAITVPRLAALRGAAAGIAAAIALTVPAWPLTALAWEAGRDGALGVVGAEAALVAAGAVLAATGAALHRVTVGRAIALDAATLAGIAAAAAAWFALV